MTNKADWRGDLGAEWARRATIMERMLDPFGDEAMAALGRVGGKTLLDLGCGGGTSTFRLARRAGARGAVLGVDVSPDLIRLAAARRAREAGHAARVGFSLADASKADFGAKAFDGLFSQFGAMFFDGQIAAYAHLRAAMKPEAPLAIICWRTPKENEWATLALGAAKPLLPPAPPTPRFAPGPFAWSVPEETFAPALSAAGWRDVAWRPVDRAIRLGDGVSMDDPIDRATAFSMKIGPLARRIQDADKTLKKAVREAVRAAMAARVEGDAVTVSGACWVVTARA